MVKCYKDLLVWQKSMDLVVRVYTLNRSFPPFEVYGLSSQMQRAAVSIPSNVAEGFERGTPGEFARFLSIASGSVAELETQIVLAKRLGHIQDADETPLSSLCDEIGKMLRSLHRTVKVDAQQK